MSARAYVYTITGTSPASAVTALLGSTVPAAAEPPMLSWDSFVIEFDIAGGTGGTTDVTLDRSWDNGTTWHEFARTAAVAAAGTAKYSVAPSLDNTIVTIGTPAAGTTAPVIANGTYAGGYPGPLVRARATGGASTSAGATNTVRIIGIRTRK